MASKDRKVREKQFAAVQEQFASRKALLEKKGLSEKDVSKDPLLKNLGSQVKKALPGRPIEPSRNPSKAGSPIVQR